MEKDIFINWGDSYHPPKKPNSLFLATKNSFWTAKGKTRP